MSSGGNLERANRSRRRRWTLIALDWSRRYPAPSAVKHDLTDCRWNRKVVRRRKKTAERLGADRPSQPRFERPLPPCGRRCRPRLPVPGGRHRRARHEPTNFDHDAAGAGERSSSAITVYNVYRDRTANGLRDRSRSGRNWRSYVAELRINSVDGDDVEMTHGRPDSLADVHVVGSSVFCPSESSPAAFYLTQDISDGETGHAERFGDLRRRADSWTVAGSTSTKPSTGRARRGRPSFSLVRLRRFNCDCWRFYNAISPRTTLWNPHSWSHLTL